MTIPSLPKISGLAGTTKSLKPPKPYLKRRLTPQSLSRQAGQLSKQMVTNHISNLIQSGILKIKTPKVKPL